MQQTASPHFEKPELNTIRINISYNDISIGIDINDTIINMDNNININIDIDIDIDIDINIKISINNLIRSLFERGRNHLMIEVNSRAISSSES